MKTASLALVVLTTLVAVSPARSALARDHESVCGSLNIDGWDPPARLASRHDTRDARIAITTEGGTTTLLITSEVVALQLSDRTMRDVRRKLRDARHEDEDDDNVLAQAIKTAVIGTVEALLSHSAECSIRDLKTVDYRNGRLIFVSEDGNRLFDTVDVDDEDVLASFSPDDAREFVAEFRRAKIRRR